MTQQDSAKASDVEGSAALLERANSAYDAGEHARALAIFNELISSGFDNEVVYNNRGACLDAMGWSEEASASYRMAVTKSPRYELAWHNLANCLSSRGLHAEAADAYRRAAKLNPSRVANLAGLASSHAKLGRRRRTRSAVRRLVAAAGKDRSVLLLGAEILLDLGAGPEAADVCSEHIRLEGESLDSLVMLGTAYHEAGSFDQAVQAFERALAFAPGSKELLNNLGYSQFCAGRMDEALRSYDRALEVDPGYKHAWYNKGYSLHGAERLTEALDCYKRSLEIDPNDRVLWNNFGNALYNLGRFDESIPKFVEALGVDPDYEIAWNNIGNALEKMGLWEDAIPFHDRSLDIRPDFDYALYAKGMCLSMTGRPEEAYDLIVESIAINPDYEDAWKARSRVARQLGRWDDALHSIEESLAVNPSFADGWADRGDILAATGDLPGADLSYRTALACSQPMLNGSQGETAQQRRKAEVLMRLGRFGEAVALLEDMALKRPFDLGVLEDFTKALRLVKDRPVPEPYVRSMEGVKDPDVLIGYGEMLIERGLNDDALAVLERLSAEGAHSERVVYLEAHAYASAGIPEEEVLDMLSGLPGPDASRFRGELAEARGDLGAAEAEFIKVLESRPSDYTAAEALARTRMRLGRPSDALAAARLAHGIDPTEPGAMALIRQANTAIARGKAPSGRKGPLGDAKGESGEGS